MLFSIYNVIYTTHFTHTIIIIILHYEIIILHYTADIGKSSKENVPGGIEKCDEKDFQINMQQNSTIVAVVMLAEKLYVLHKDSKFVSVYSWSPLTECKHLHELTLPLLEEPGAVAVCSVKNCLYVSDLNSANVFVVNQCEKVETIHLNKAKTKILATNSCGFLVFVTNDDEIHTYSLKNKRVTSKFKIEDVTTIHNIIQSQERALLVCYGRSYLCEINYSSDKTRTLQTVSKLREIQISTNLSPDAYIVKNTNGDIIIALNIGIDTEKLMAYSSDLKQITLCKKLSDLYAEVAISCVGDYLLVGSRSPTDRQTVSVYYKYLEN